MRTTKFYGEINGEIFNNVNLYNQRMKELIDNGVVNINAKSETKIVNEEDEQKRPNFKTPGLKGKDLVGYIVDADNDVTDTNLNDALNEMEDDRNRILESLKDWTEEDINEYIKVLEDSLGKIKVYKDASLKSWKQLKIQLDSLQSQVDELVDKQDTVSNAEMVLSEFDDWYNEFIKTIKNVRRNQECQCGGTCNCGGNCTCKCTKEPQEVTYEIKPKDGIKELAKLLGII